MTILEMVGNHLKDGGVQSLGCGVIILRLVVEHLREGWGAILWMVGDHSGNGGQPSVGS